jgi:hypothetical protein
MSDTFEIAKILVTEHDLEVMLPRFLSCLIGELEPADAGSVWLHDPLGRLPDGQGGTGL